MYLKGTFSRFVDNKVLTSVYSVCCYNVGVMKLVVIPLKKEDHRFLLCKMVDPRGFA